MPAAARHLCLVLAACDGMAAVVATLVELKARGGYRISAVVNDRHSPLARRLEAAGIAVHQGEFDFAAFPGWRGLVRRSAALARLLRRERVDVILTCLWHSMLVGRLAGWMADVPVRLTRIAGPFHLEAPLSRWLDRRTCWIDHAIIGVSEEIAGIYRGFGVQDDRIRVSHAPRDARMFTSVPRGSSGLRTALGLAPDTPLVGMVSWFYPPVPASYWSPPRLWGRAVKGHETFIEAAGLVHAEHPDVHFVMVGGAWGTDGAAYLERIRALAAASPAAAHLHFIGGRSDIPAIYADLDVAVHPSLSEGTGAAAESLFAGCPTVAAHAGGLADLVIDGRTGLLAEMDDARGVARGVSTLLREPARAAAMAAAGRAHARQLCDLGTAADVLASLCRETHQRKASRASGHRLVVRLSRTVLAVPLAAALSAGLRGVEVQARRSAGPAERPHVRRKLLDCLALLAVGPHLELRLTGWIRQRVALAKGHARTSRQRWAARVSTVWAGLLALRGSRADEDD